MTKKVHIPIVKHMSIKEFLIAASFVISIFGLTVTGCKGEKGDIGSLGPGGPTGPPGPPGPTLTGTIRGFVTLRKENGTFDPIRNKVSVLIEGTAITDTSDSTGRWQLDSVSSGSYTIAFSRPGYSTMKYFGLQFIGNGEMYLYPTLLQATSFNVTSILIFRSPTATILNGTISSASADGRLVYLYISKSNTVSSTNFTYLSIVQVKPNLTAFSDTLTRTAMNAAGFPSGTTMYIAAYGMNIDYPALSHAYSYIDPVTGQEVIASLSEIPRFISAQVP